MKQVLLSILGCLTVMMSHSNIFEIHQDSNGTLQDKKEFQITANYKERNPPSQSKFGYNSDEMPNKFLDGFKRNY